MSMHMIRGIQVHGKSKLKRKPGWKKVVAEHEAFLKKMGVKNTKSNYRAELPDYSTGPRMTSDAIPGNGSKVKANEYTGDYIIAIGTMHKSNAVPVTRKKEAEDMAKMRR